MRELHGRKTALLFGANAAARNVAWASRLRVEAASRRQAPKHHRARRPAKPQARRLPFTSVGRTANPRGRQRWIVSPLNEIRWTRKASHDRGTRCGRGVPWPLALSELSPQTKAKNKSWTRRQRSCTSHASGLYRALGWLGGRMGVALVWLWGRNRLPIGCLATRFGVALRWLWAASRSRFGSLCADPGQDHYPRSMNRVA
jgi:hypothetical protein